MITKAMLASDGIFEKKASRVSKPPAEAPMPTIGKPARLVDFFPFFCWGEDVCLAGEFFLTLAGMAGAFLSEESKKEPNV